MDGSKGFPRGGKIKKKQTDSTSATDIKLFQCTDKSKEKKAKTKKGKNAKNKESGNQENVKKIDDEKIEPLKQEDLEPQMLVLGRVRAVHQTGLLISLPCMLTGFVPLHKISASFSILLTTNRAKCSDLSVMFSVGQYVCCMVESCDISGEKARNTLSISPVDINSTIAASLLHAGMMLQCAVRSVEDNAYDMECGVPSARAVLPKSGLGDSNRSLVCGQVVWCVVTSVTVTDLIPTLTLSADPGHVARAEVTPGSPLTPQTLIPGMRTSVTVSQIFASGLQLCYMSDRTAFACKTHLDELSDVPDDYNIGAKTFARVLYTLPTVRRLHVSVSRVLNSQFVDSSEDGVMQLVSGAPVNGCVIDADDRAIRLNHAETGSVLLCPGWNAVNSASGGRWKPGETVKCWPVSRDLMDGYQIVSMKPTAKKKTVSDYRIGQKVTCTVEEVKKNGCEVLVKDKAAFIPLHHLTNFPVSDLQSKFAVGKKLKCQVLNVDKKQNRLVLTHKSRLVNGEVTLFTANTMKLNARGFVVSEKISTNGVLVSGCGGATAFIPASFIGPKLLDDYYIGRLLECSVESISQKDGQPRIILRPIAEELRGDCDFVGRVMDATVVSRQQDNLVVSLENGVQAQIPCQHLTDIPEHETAMLSHYKPGDFLRVVGLVCLADKYLVSAKPSFLNALAKGSYPASSNEILVGMKLPCSVVSSSATGVKVMFPCAALPKTHNIAAKFLGDGWSSTSEILHKISGRTLIAKIVDLPTVSRTSYLLSARFDRFKFDRESVSYVRVGLKELRLLVPRMLSPGCSVSGVVTSVTAAGDAIIRSDCGITGVLPSVHSHCCSPKVGERLTASVVRTTPAGQMALVAEDSVVSFEKGRKPLCKRGGLTARIVSVESGYFVSAVLLPPAEPCVVHIATRGGYNDVLTSGLKSEWKLGEVVAIRIKSYSANVLIAVEVDSTDVKALEEIPQRQSGITRTGSFHRKSGKKFAKRAASSTRTPSKRVKTSAVSYSRFSLTDSSL